MIGKFPPEYLRKYIFSRIGKYDRDVILGPSIGEDSAIISIGDRYLVIHVDPITGSVKLLGWLAVHIVSNDIAVTGAEPRWLLPVYMFPTETSEDFIDSVTSQVNEAAKEINAMIVGGHSEFTPNLSRPIISMTGLGIVKKDYIVTTSGAKSGDRIIMTKYVALEGTMILAGDFREVLVNKGVSIDVINESLTHLKEISVVKEALLLSSHKYATSLHDPTEGGLIGGLTEMAYASKKTFVVDESKLNVREDTKLYCNVLGIDYLRLISSGVLIATVDKGDVEKAIKLLANNGIEAREIGYVRDYNGNFLEFRRTDGGIETYDELIVTDELMRLWNRLRG